MKHVAEHPRPERDEKAGGFLSALAEWASLSMTMLAISGFLAAKFFGTDLATVKLFDIKVEALAPALALVAGAGLVYIVRHWIVR